MYYYNKILNKYTDKTNTKQVTNFANDLKYKAFESETQNKVIAFIAKHIFTVQENRI